MVDLKLLPNRLRRRHRLTCRTLRVAMTFQGLLWTLNSLVKRCVNATERDDLHGSGSACGKRIRFSKGAAWTVSICFHISHAHLGSGLKYSRICHSGAFSEAGPRCVLVNASLSQFQVPSDRSAIARQQCRCTKLGHCFPDI